MRHRPKPGYFPRASEALTRARELREEHRPSVPVEPVEPMVGDPWLSAWRDALTDELAARGQELRSATLTALLGAAQSITPLSDESYDESAGVLLDRDPTFRAAVGHWARVGCESAQSVDDATAVALSGIESEGWPVTQCVRDCARSDVELVRARRALCWYLVEAIESVAGITDDALATMAEGFLLRDSDCAPLGALLVEDDYFGGHDETGVVYLVDDFVRLARVMVGERAR